MKWRTGTNIRTWLPKLQCHRGYWIEGLQQNSLKSVQEAARKNFRMAEFDVRLTKDNVVILFHDESYKGRKVETFLFEEFLDATRAEYPDTATLDEVLRWLKNEIGSNRRLDFKLNIEIKSKKLFNAVLENETYKLIKKYGVEKFMLISSFNPITLYRFKKLDSGIYRAQLVTNDHESNFILNNMYFNFLSQPDVLHLRWNDFGEAKYHNLPVPVVLWTVNEVSQIENFKDQVFGFISDRIAPAMGDRPDRNFET